MPTPFRIATYNIEWFTRLFDDNNQVIITDDASARYKVTKKQQAEAIANVLKKIDADLVCIVEAPDTSKSSPRSTITSLENFAAKFGLRTRNAMTGIISKYQQEIALLFDPGKISVTHEPQGTRFIKEDGLPYSNFKVKSYLEGRKLSPSPRFDSFYVLDLEDDGVNEIHYFSRPPMEAKVNFHKDDDAVVSARLLGVHVKSKAVYGPSDEIQTPNISLGNRRSLLAQCQWLRDRVEEILAKNEHVIVLGDFNDGPGLDFYERQFGRSAVEIVMGDIGNPGTLLHNPFSRVTWDKAHGWKPASASFYQQDTKTYKNDLIDFILTSASLAGNANHSWHIWHPYDDKEIKNNKAIQKAFLTASDHFPVTIDLAF